MRSPIAVCYMAALSSCIAAHAASRIDRHEVQSTAFAEGGVAHSNSTLQGNVSR